MLRLAVGCACWSVIAACGDFETELRYRGVRRLSDAPLEVRTVFWPSEGALVFAVDANVQGPPVMHLLPVSGASSCKAGPVNRFAAVIGDEGFRLALFDRRAKRVRFYDENCAVWEPDVDGVDALNLRSGRSGHQFMIETGDMEADDRRLFVAEPYARRVTQLASRFERMGSGVLRPRGEDALWVLADSTLGVIDVLGKSEGPTFDGVAQFANHQGLGSDGQVRAFVAVQQSRVLSLWDLTGALMKGELSDGEELWTESDSCGPRIDVVAGSCVGDGCRDALEGAPGERRPVPWVSFFSPCDDRRLVMRSDSGSEALELAAGVNRYRVIEAAIKGLPVVVYSLVDDDEQDWIQVAGQAPVGLGTRVALDSVRVLTDALLLNFITDEDGAPRRMVIWDPERGGETVVSGVENVSASGFVLHDFDEDTKLGRLSFCAFQRCRTVADAVPSQSYVTYDSLERISEPAPLLAYLHAVDPDTRTGTLTVRDRGTGAVVDVAKGVSAFAPVELGGARGIVYTVPEGDRRGLWYAPR